MKRSFAVILSLAALLGAPSVNAAPEGRFDAQTFRPLAAPRDLVAGAQFSSDATEAVPMELGKISPEERERRESECEKLWLACLNYCERKFRAPVDIRLCKDECGQKLAACMKKIPYAE